MSAPSELNSVAWPQAATCLDRGVDVRMMFGMDPSDFAHRDALMKGPAHRRGAGLNPGNRFEDVRLHVLGEEIDRQFVEHEREDGTLQRVERQVFLDRTKTIINRVARSSDVPFDWTVNPYRGCEHGCIYSRRYGLNRDVRPMSGSHFRRPESSGQLRLFS